MLPAVNGDGGGRLRPGDATFASQTLERDRTASYMTMFGG